MKDYDRYVVWLDYFNSELKRNEGRRVPLSSATKAPKLDELTEACNRLSLQPSSQAARFPSGGSRESGYVSVPKSDAKHVLLIKIARELAAVRGIAQKKQSQTSRPKKK